MAVTVHKKSKKENNNGGGLLKKVFSTTKDVMTGAYQGAALGSKVPGVGTQTGMVVGGLLGLFGSKKK